MPEVIIEASALHKEYSGFPAVKGIDFAVAKGECFGFLGPNGAGKTTTMNMVQGYSPITSGTLTVFGMDRRKDHRNINARLGVVPQENNLDPDITVLENLLIYARYFDIPKSVARERAASLLDFMSLTDKKDERIPKLSGGMKRRLMVARALINEPELIILDEPTTGLDPQARHMIWQRLGELKSSGRTLVLTTHYMEEAEHLCDRLVIMDGGKILTEGTPRKLIKKYVKGSVVELAMPESGPARVLECLKGIEFEHEVSGSVLYIYTEDAATALDKAACFAASGFRHRQATLEDVFLKLTGRELRE
ncbi:MAG: ATP-binding cassette domain-containing protein [Nitrospirae bacterium]|nr:ATP-binding cassette domain-containing protein [Nitrospirota bacterium]